MQMWIQLHMQPMHLQMNLNESTTAWTMKCECDKYVCRVYVVTACVLRHVVCYLVM